jgi:hypothetical protein
MEHDIPGIQIFTAEELRDAVFGPDPDPVRHKPGTRSLPTFHIGQKVKLNKQGWATCKPSGPEEARAAIEGFTLLRIGQAELCDDVRGVFSIEVSGPLNIYLLSTADIEPV